MTPERQRRVIEKTVKLLNQKKNQEVDFFSGLSEDQKSFKTMKILWLLFLTSCCTICACQVIGRVRYYFTFPTTIQVSIEKLRENDFPQITMCTPHTQLHEKLNGGQNIQRGIYLQLSSDEYWKIINTTTTIKDVYFTKSEMFYKKASIESFNHFKGACTNVFAGGPLPTSDPSLKLHIVFNKMLTLLTLFARQRKLEFVDLASNLRNGPVNSLLKVIVTFEKTIFANAQNRPCVDEKERDHCDLKCEQQYYSHKLPKCKYPFMITETELPFCTMPRDFLEYLAICRETGVFMKNVCKCIRSCISFTTYFRSEYIDINREEIVVSMESDEFQTIEHKLIYNFISLLCDIGGNVSLYLGLSCLTFVQLLIQSLHQLKLRKNWKQLPHRRLVSKVSR